MTDTLNHFIEISISIFLVVTCAASTFTLMAILQNPIVVIGYDKTFIDSTGTQTLYEERLTGSDLLMSLLNTDPMSPYPKAIKINNTPVIKLDNSFIASKISKVGSIYHSTGQWKLSTMLEYVVTKREFVYTGPDAPYIHYTLEVS